MKNEAEAISEELSDKLKLKVSNYFLKMCERDRDLFDLKYNYTLSQYRKLKKEYRKLKKSLNK